LPLDRIGLSLPAYLERLGSVIHGILKDFSVKTPVHTGEDGVWVGQRLLASLGIAVQDWVAYFGAYLNVDPDLEPFRLVRSATASAEAMTSLVRERRGPVRPSLVRERVIEQFAACFGFERMSLFSDHPSLHGPPKSRRLAHRGHRE
jgi:lipoate-protein ligase B